MIERLDLYRCEICGNLVEVILAGGGELVCCGQPMHKLEGKNEEEAPAFHQSEAVPDL